MDEHENPLLVAILKAFAWVGVWLGTVKLAELQLAVSICSGLVVGALAAVNLYITLRDKLPRSKKP